MSKKDEMEYIASMIWRGRPLCEFVALADDTRDTLKRLRRKVKKLRKERDSWRAKYEELVKKGGQR